MKKCTEFQLITRCKILRILSIILSRHSNVKETSFHQAHRALKKMPILSQLSRRFHDMLTTDAKPDPPRTEIKGYTHNLPPTPDEESKRTQSKSAPTTPENERDDDVATHRQKSVPDDARPTTPTDFCTKPEDLGDAKSTNESKEYKRPRTKTKSKHSKYCKL